MAETQPSWTELLDEEDLAFIKRLVLASGSLKEIAAAYGVSYPTVRLRLDRLIEKLKVADSRQPLSPFERLLRLQHAEGKIDLSTMKRLLAAHREEMQHEAPRRK
jgi:hypothetical protein